MLDDIAVTLYLVICVPNVIMSPTMNAAPDATSIVSSPAAAVSFTVVTVLLENASAPVQTDTLKLLPSFPAHLAVKAPALEAALPEW